ncbi:MAG: hypothetical protein Q9162_001044 [Coniocarpon cinnabarinum]
MLGRNVLTQVVALVLCVLTRVVVAQGNEYFITPPATGAVHDYTGNKEYQNGSSLLLEWYSDFASNTLLMFQNDNDHVYVVFDSKGPGQLTYNWTVGFPNREPSLPNIYFFRMTTPSDSSQVFSSHYFNITGDAPPQANDSSDDGNQGASNSTNSHNDQNGNSTSGAGGNNGSNDSSSGLSSGAKAGIGVGVAVGAVAIIALAGAMYWYKKKASRVHHENNLGMAGFFGDRKTGSVGSGATSDQLPQYHAPPAEMDNSGAKTEMADTSVPKRDTTAPTEMPA